MNYEIKITGNGTSKEITNALNRLVATIEETTRSYRLEIGTIELDDEGFLIEITEEYDNKYILSENAINGITINEKIRNEDLFEYYIIGRKEFIYDLIGWIAEADGNNLILMREDLEMLMDVKDDYILSSISTNKYLYSGCSEFNETCKELLELNSSKL